MKQFIVFFIILITQQDLWITDKQIQGELLSKGDLVSIEYSLLPYGEVPMGREIYGYVVLTNTDMCQNFYSQINTEDYPMFFLTNSQGCGLKKKSLNAESSGSKLLLIQVQQNETPKDVIQKLSQKDYGSIGIPSLLISYESGEKLKNFVEKYQKVILKFTVPVPQSKIVKIEFYVHTNNKKLFEFIISLEEHFKQLKDSIELEFKFLPYQHVYTQELAAVENYINCIPSIWEYRVLEHFFENCIALDKFNQDCLIKNMFKIAHNQKDKIKQCALDKGSKSSELSKEIQQREKINDQILINNKLYQGSYQSESFFESVCGAFEETPKACLFLQNKYSVYMSYDQVVQQRLRTKNIKKKILYLITMLLLIAGGMIIYKVYEKVYSIYLQNNIESIVRSSMGTYEAIESQIISQIELQLFKIKENPYQTL